MKARAMSAILHQKNVSRGHSLKRFGITTCEVHCLEVLLQPQWNLHIS